MIGKKSFQNKEIPSTEKHSQLDTESWSNWQMTGKPARPRWIFHHSAYPLINIDRQGAGDIDWLEFKVSITKNNSIEAGA